MRDTEAGKCFTQIKNLWPKWDVNITEKTEWLKVLSGMNVEIAETAISVFFQEFGRYDRPAMPDFLTVARRVSKAVSQTKRGTAVELMRTSDRYRRTIVIYNTQDPDEIIRIACKYRDEFIAKTKDYWQVIRPEDAVKSEPLTAENKQEIDNAILNGPDCSAKTFLLGVYARRMDSELGQALSATVANAAEQTFAEKYKL